MKTKHPDPEFLDRLSAFNFVMYSSFEKAVVVTFP